MSIRTKERDDCSVRAVAVAVGVPYRVAHAALKEAGRKNRKGAYDETIFAAVAYLGCAVRFRPIHKGARVKDIAAWLARLPAALASTKNHVYAAADGVIFDEAPKTHKVIWLAEIIHVGQTSRD